jgi:DnaK suppressor protein
MLHVEMGSVTVRVVPRSGRTDVEGGPDGVVVRVRAAPERGRATEEARRALAEAAGVPPSAVRLRTGERARTKVFEVDGVAAEELARRLGTGADRRPLSGNPRDASVPRTMASKTVYSKKELDDLRERLETERSELEVQLTTIEEESFATSQSDISGEVSFDEENADAGTFTFERERDLSIENNVRDLLAKIARALAKMDEGTYGICARCGKPIEKARLKALPYVDLCLKDAQAQSRR